MRTDNENTVLQKNRIFLCIIVQLYSSAFAFFIKHCSLEKYKYVIIYTIWVLLTIVMYKDVICYIMLKHTTTLSNIIDSY